MTWIDWVIIALLLVSTIAGLAQGFLRTACSLIGLFLGLFVAAWNYRFVAGSLSSIVHNESTANIIAFLLIAVLAIGICNLLGKMLSKTLEFMGLGCLDVLAGGVLGFAQGVGIITLFLVGIVAFFPATGWLAGAKLPPLFFGACHISTHMTPTELGDKVKSGIRTLELETKTLLQQKNGVS